MMYSTLKHQIDPKEIAKKLLKKNRLYPLLLRTCLTLVKNPIGEAEAIDSKSPSLADLDKPLVHVSWNTYPFEGLKGEVPVV